MAFYSEQIAERHHFSYILAFGLLCSSVRQIRKLGFDMADEQPEDFSKLPLEEKLSHKVVLNREDNALDSAHYISSVLFMPIQLVCSSSAIGL